MYVIMRTCLGDTLPFIHSRSTIIQAYLASHWYGSVVASSTPDFCVQFATDSHRVNILWGNVWKSWKKCVSNNVKTDNDGPADTYLICEYECYYIRPSRCLQKIYPENDKKFKLP